MASSSFTSTFTSTSASIPQHQPQPRPRIKAIFFDFMGTCLDWCRAVEEHLPASIPYPARRQLALDWRVAYFGENERRRKAGLPVENIDTTLLRTLDQLLSASPSPRDADPPPGLSSTRPSSTSLSSAAIKASSQPEDYALSSLMGKYAVYAPLFQHPADPSVTSRVVAAWHAQPAWPDVAPALAALRAGHIGDQPAYELFVHANGTTRLQLDLVRSAGLRPCFDLLFSSEMLGELKPAPGAYERALHLTKYEPEECVMVAAHVADLRGAKAVGMRTVYIFRETDDVHEHLEEVEAEFDAVLGRQGEKGEVGKGMDGLVDVVQRLGGDVV